MTDPEGPQQRWQRMAPAHRLCRSSAALMRTALRLRARGVRDWELAAAVEALLAALVQRRHGR